MKRDFTLSEYRKLIETINRSEYATTTVADYLLNALDKCIILRHDVDRDVQRAVDMAQLEHEYDIASTYYFRHIKDVFNPEVIKEIKGMGHEIGFHYEVMDKAKGNTEKAITIFKQELEELRGVAEITTICMHGNPFAPWANRDLWKKYNFKDFGIIGEPYLSIDYSKVLYLTDTGRTWSDLKIRVKDTVSVPDTKIKSQTTESIASTDNVIELIKTAKISQICLLVHPNRWCDDISGWMKELVSQNIKNIGKAGIVWYRSRKNVL